LRVLYLASAPRLDSSVPAGHTLHIERTIRGLEEAGHEVERLLAGDSPAARRAKRGYRRFGRRLTSVLRFALRDLYWLLNDASVYRRCLRSFRGVPFDFVYERATQFHRSGSRVAATWRIPHVYELNSPVEELSLRDSMPPLQRVALRRQRRNLDRAAAVVVGSHALRERLIESGIAAKRVHVIYPTAGDEWFCRGASHDDRPGAPPPAAAIGLEGKLVIGFVGSIRGLRRLDLLPQAAAAILPACSDVHFLLVGDGDARGSLEAQFAAAGLDGHVTFTGRVPHTVAAELCLAMDVCVIPDGSCYATPTKLFEYGALGRCVVAANVAPIAEIVRDGVTGRLVAPGDAAELARVLLTLLGDASLRRDLGRRLRAELRAAHTWRRNTERLIDIVGSARQD